MPHASRVSAEEDVPGVVQSNRSVAAFGTIYRDLVNGKPSLDVFHVDNIGCNDIADGRLEPEISYGSYLAWHYLHIVHLMLASCHALACCSVPVDLIGILSGASAFSFMRGMCLLTVRLQWV